jgi:hypothetical protein
MAPSTPSFRCSESKDDGYQVAVTGPSTQRYPLPQEVLELPEAVVYDHPTPIASLLRPTLDALWNARGPNFKEDGSWAQRR